MKYIDELINSMEWLGKKQDTIFLGQAVSYSGNAMYNTTKTISEDKLVELPVFEDVQMGMSMGMALEGFVPITSYPRFDFLICATNQLVNHLDKINIISEGQFQPRVIIRTSTFDKPEKFPPQAHIFIRSKASWIDLDDKIPSFESMYDRAKLWPKASLDRLSSLS